MSLDMVTIARTNFRTDEDSDRLNTTFMRYLGMNDRYLPARLAISRSLAISALPTLDKNRKGNAIKGDILFGTGADLSVWASLIIEHANDPDIDVTKLVSLVSAHWRRGLELLNEEWKRSNKDTTKFVRYLMSITGLPKSGDQSSPVILENGNTVSSSKILVPVGETAEEVTTKEKIRWDLNGSGGSPHSAIMGGVGSGKTRTAVSMLRSIHEQSPAPLLAFDFKGDLGTDVEGNGYHVDQLFSARILEPPRKPIPLDVLHMQSTSKIDIDEAASRFRASFSRLQGSSIGPRQRTLVHDAATRALTRMSKSQESCELNHILEDLISIYEERAASEDGALSTMREICRFPLFHPKYDPASFFSKSWIIKLPQNVSADSRTIVVNLVLDALDYYLNSLSDSECASDGSRNLRIVCMVDEAHKILGTKLPSLSNLIRMSRSKGGAIMLISQSPDDFSGEDEEFLSEMGLVMAFATNAPPRQATRILGKGAKLETLQTGQCFVKRREDTISKKVQAWPEL